MALKFKGNPCKYEIFLAIRFYVYEPYLFFFYARKSIDLCSPKAVPLASLA